MRRLRTPLLLLLLLLVGARAALPYVVARVLEDQVASQTPFLLTVEDVDLRLLAGGARVEGATLEAPTTTDAEGPRLTLGALDLEVDWLPLFDRRVHVRAIALERASLRAALGEAGAVDWVALVEGAPAAPPDEESDTAPGDDEGFAIVLDRADLDPLDLEFRHAPSGRTFHQRFQLEVRDFVLGEDFAFELRSEGDLGDLQLGGEVRPEPLRVDGTVRSEALYLAALGAVVDDPGFGLGSGSLAVDLGVALSQSESSGTEAKVSGSLMADEVAFTLGDGASGEAEALSLELDDLVALVASSRLDVQGGARLEGRSLALRPAADESVATEQLTADLELSFDQETGSDSPEQRVRVAGPIELTRLAATLPSAGVGEAALGGLRVALQRFELASGEADGSTEIEAKLELSELTSSLAVPAGDGLALERFDLTRLDAPVEALALPGPVLRLGRVEIETPIVDLRRGGASLPTSSGDAAPEDADETDAGSPEAALQLDIASVVLRGGRIRLDDRTLAPAEPLQLAGIALDLEALRVPGAAGGLGLELGSSQLAVASLGAKPLIARASIAGPKLDASVVADRVDLVPFAAYAASAGGYSIPKGRLSADIEARAAKGRIDAPIGLVFHDLRLKRERKDAPLGRLFREVGVSVDTALALLRDPKGRISLNIPVKSSKGGTRVALTPILRDGLVQALTGALASPLKLAGAALEGVSGSADAIALARLDFAPGSHELDDASVEALDGVAKLLTSRPGLAIVLESRVTREDEHALAERLGVAPPGESAEADDPRLAGLQDALAGLADERLATARAALVGHAELAVDESRLQGVVQPSPVIEGASSAELELRIGGLPAAPAPTPGPG